MSYAEFVDWCRYRERFGTLNVGMRVDRAVARAISAYFNAHSQGRKFKIEDFSPYDQITSDVDVNDVDQVFQVLKGVANGVSRDSDA